MMNKNCLWQSFLQVLLVTSTLAAQSPIQPDANKADPIVVTVSGKAMPLSSVPASVTVVPREEIEASHAVNLAELLQNTTGIHISHAGGRGALSSATIRGGDPNFVLVMVDGVPVNDPNNALGGAFDFSSMSLLNVDRVEIVRGPLSTMFGTDAMSGAINVITRRDEAASTTITAALGTFDSRDAQIVHSGSVRKFSYTAGGSYTSVDDQVEKDPYFLKSLSFHWAVPLGRMGMLQWNSRLDTSGSNGLPENGGGPLFSILRDAQHRRTRDAMGALEYSNSIRQWWTIRGQADLFNSHQRLSIPTILDRIPPGPQTVPTLAATSDLLRSRIQVANDFQLRQNWSTTVTVGGYKEDGTNDGTLAGFIPASFDSNRTTKFVTGELQYTSNQINASAGARTDFVDGFRRRVSPRFSISYVPGKSRTRLRFNFGEAFRLPSLYALGNPLIGNEDLRAEHSRSFEVAGVYLLPAGKGQISATVFDERYRDLIDFSASLFRLVNRSAAVARGIELEGNVSIHETLSLKANTTYTDAELTGSTEPLRDRPRWRSGMQAAWKPVPRIQVNLNTIWVGERADLQLPVPARSVAPRYTETTVGADFTRGDVTLFLKVQNLFNEKFQQFVGFPDPGRWFTAGLRFHSAR